MKHFTTGVIVGAASAGIAYAAGAPPVGWVALGAAVFLLVWIGPLANRRS